MTDQEFEQMWDRAKEHDRTERDEWLSKSKEERERIKRETDGFRSWEDMTDSDKD